VVVGVLALLVLGGTVPVCWSFLAVRRGIELRPDGITVRRALSTTVVPWHQIAEIDVIRVMGVRRVDLRMRNGRVRHLPAPVETMVFKDPEFEAAAQMITQWWTAAAGFPHGPRSPG
jgi:hypothetical protein